jgi:uncharacterized membrane protein (UPF0127 family)
MSGRVMIAIIGGLLVAACGGQSAAPAPFDQLRIHTGQAVVRLRVEIAETQEEQSRGLSLREHLPEDRGMVFLFDGPTRGGFWMKDTLIPLSIAFWDGEDRIVRILDMEPCEADPCPVYAPGVSYVGALEVNQGFFQQHRVEIGDRIDLDA